MEAHSLSLHLAAAVKEPEIRRACLAVERILSAGDLLDNLSPVALEQVRDYCTDYNKGGKPPVALGLRALPPISSVDKCYMKELGSCDGAISGEHLFSHSIMLLLKGDGDFSISGVPWLTDGETKIMSPTTLTANCLCRKHNSALAPLDDAALYFFTFGSRYRALAPQDH